MKKQHGGAVPADRCSIRRRRYVSGQSVGSRHGATTAWLTGPEKAGVSARSTWRGMTGALGRRGGVSARGRVVEQRGKRPRTGGGSRGWGTGVVHGKHKAPCSCVAEAAALIAAWPRKRAGARRGPRAPGRRRRGGHPRAWRGRRCRPAPGCCAAGCCRRRRCCARR